MTSLTCLFSRICRSGLLLCCCLVLAVQVVASSPAVKKTLLVYGDSLSAAHGFDSRKGWVTLLQEKLVDSHPEWHVVNASISGETTAGGLNRLPDILATHAPDLVLLELGANDGLQGLSPGLMKENLGRMIRLVQKKSATLLLFEMRIPPNYGPVYNRRFQKVFSDLAKNHEVTIVPFFLDGVAGRPDLNQADGIHPKSIAQHILLGNVFKILVKEL